jgi:hypothetical protein
VLRCTGLTAKTLEGFPPAALCCAMLASLPRPWRVPSCCAVLRYAGLIAKTLEGSLLLCCAVLCWPRCQKCCVARMSLCISADPPALPRSDSWKHKLPPPLLRLRRGLLSAQLSCSRRENWDHTSGCTSPFGP